MQQPRLVIASASTRSATVIAIRTAAVPAPSDHGWSGMAKTRRTGRRAAIASAITRRQKVWRMLFEVMNPNRRALAFGATSACAAFHQKNSAMSAEFGTFL